MTEPSPTSSRRLEADLNLQRKAALAWGRATDHAGRVRISVMEDFDMGRTIFGGMEGALPRMVMRDKLAKEAHFSDDAAREIEAAFQAAERDRPTPAIDPDLIDFMVEQCDFSMEHADGTFLQHLVFCHDYAARYYPDHSPNVALLHSILGTATNTFAMKADRIPKLQERLTDFEFRHVQAFPSLLRLFYDQAFLSELRRNADRLDRWVALRCHRVIDNAELVLEAEDVWIELNYHLMHFVDFMPPANWAAHRSDPLVQQFEELSTFLDEVGQRRARVQIEFPRGPARLVGEPPTWAGRISRAIPIPIKKKLARKTIRRYSDLAGHSLDYTLEFR